MKAAVAFANVAGVGDAYYVKFKVQKDCLPLPESTFKHAIKDNYVEQFRFNPRLNAQQVENLCKLFQPVRIRRPTPPSVSAAGPVAMAPSARGHLSVVPVISAVSASNHHREDRLLAPVVPEIARPKDREYPVGSHKLHGPLVERRPPRRMAYPVEDRQGIRSGLSLPGPERDEHHSVLEDRRHVAGRPAPEVVHRGHVPLHGRDRQVLHDVGPLYEEYQVHRGHVPLHEREYELYRDRVPVHEREYQVTRDRVPLHGQEYQVPHDRVPLYEREYQVLHDPIPLHEREYPVPHDRIPLPEREYQEPRVGRELGGGLYSSRLQVDELQPVSHEKPLYHRATTYEESTARQQVVYDRPNYDGGVYGKPTTAYGDPRSEIANMPVSSRVDDTLRQELCSVLDFGLLPVLIGLSCS
ncbi:hypothetical protein EJ110_NYTH24770 [Nymphaea thermarum]|nr:hypothetical protein EJ110_NYTH24770 [Nymphaea thermarum]